MLLLPCWQPGAAACVQRMHAPSRQRALLRLTSAGKGLGVLQRLAKQPGLLQACKSVVGGCMAAIEREVWQEVQLLGEYSPNGTKQAEPSQALPSFCTLFSVKCPLLRPKEQHSAASSPKHLLLPCLHAGRTASQLSGDSEGLFRPASSSTSSAGTGSLPSVQLEAILTLLVARPVRWSALMTLLSNFMGGSHAAAVWGNARLPRGRRVWIHMGGSVCLGQAKGGWNTSCTLRISCLALGTCVSIYPCAAGPPPDLHRQLQLSAC